MIFALTHAQEPFVAMVFSRPSSENNVMTETSPTVMVVIISASMKSAAMVFINRILVSNVTMETLWMMMDVPTAANSQSVEIIFSSPGKTVTMETRSTETAVTNHVSLKYVVMGIISPILVNNVMMATLKTPTMAAETTVRYHDVVTEL
jgi:hypothetical protein